MLATDMQTQRRVTDGGRALRRHLDALNQSVPDFCEAHDLDRIAVQRVLNGDRWQRITVDFASAIHRATKGRVRWSLFLSSTARTPRSSEIGRRRLEHHHATS
jgi:hypothetical protein